MPCLKETSIGMFIPDVVHAFLIASAKGCGGSAMPTCFNPINHRGNRKKQEYFDIALLPHPFAEAINESVHYIWNEDPNACFFHTWHIILASLWLYMGHQLSTLTFLIFNRWK